MTEKLLAGTLRIITNKANYVLLRFKHHFIILHAFMKHLDSDLEGLLDLHSFQNIGYEYQNYAVGKQTNRLITKKVILSTISV